MTGNPSDPCTAATFSILATADLHLGSPAEDLRTWELIIQQALRLRVDCLVVAGDLLDQQAGFDRVSGILSRGFARLEEAGIGVILVTGNHDYALLPELLMAAPRKNVKLLGAWGKWEFLEITKRGIRVRFAGRSFPETGHHLDPLEGIDPLLPGSDCPTIALLHCDTTDPHSPFGYADPSLMAGYPVNAWILGHLHQPRVVSRKPLILYAGEPDRFLPGRNDPCGNDPCGPVLLELDRKGVRKWEWAGPG